MKSLTISDALIVIKEADAFIVDTGTVKHKVTTAQHIQKNTDDELLLRLVYNDCNNNSESFEFYKKDNDVILYDLERFYINSPYGKFIITPLFSLSIEDIITKFKR